MHAGDRVEGVLLLRNTSDSTRFVRVYKTDYFFSIDKTVYGEPGQLPRSNADWISFRPASVTLQPQEEAVIHYRIEMPVESDELKLSGTYWSVIMVEGIDEEDLALEDMSHSGTGVGIRLRVRYAVQIVTHYGDTGSRALEIIGRRLAYDELNGVFLEIDLMNTGERWLRPDIRLELFDDQGFLVDAFDGQRARLYPGTSVRRRIDLSAVASGAYQGVLYLDAGEDLIWGARYSIQLE